MTDTAKTAAALALVATAAALWIGGTVACLSYAARPGCAGAVLAAMFVACAGWGFMGEARRAAGRLL